MPLIPVTATAALLSTLLPQSMPWLDIQAASEQRPPVYLGLSPRALAFGAVPSAGKLDLPLELKQLAEAKLQAMARKLGTSRFEVEAWPAQNDQGKRTWTFARWRENPAAPWKWIESEQSIYRPWIETERAQIFDDFLLMDDLYAKPVFGDCIWASEDQSTISAMWLSPEDRSSRQAELLRDQRAGTRLVCHALPQPARLDGQPFELVLSHGPEGITWPSSIQWVTQSKTAPQPISPEARIENWPSDFDAAYRDDVLTLSGAQDAIFPISGRRMRFNRKNSADPKNQLLDLITYLEERYAKLGIQTKRETFTWRGIPQSNLIAVIRGTGPGASQRPILLADHIDTAFCEDTFAATRERVSAPGADDNVTAVAALLRAAEILRSRAPQRDIWLVHLTGEEFPGDDLGARKLVSQLLARKQDIGGLVLMDMIGFHKRADGLFQISAGDSAESLRMAGIALGASLELAPPTMVPVIRPRFDERSYLFNTDGLIFSDAGFPVILFNEHLNYLENLNRKGYHQTTDTASNPRFDFAFASAIARMAIQTAATLSDAPLPH